MVGGVLLPPHVGVANQGAPGVDVGRNQQLVGEAACISSVNLPTSTTLHTPVFLSLTIIEEKQDAPS